MGGTRYGRQQALIVSRPSATIRAVDPTKSQTKRSLLSQFRTPIRDYPPVSATIRVEAFVPNSQKHQEPIRGQWEENGPERHRIGMAKHRLEGSGLRGAGRVAILSRPPARPATPSYRPNTRTPSPPLAVERFWGEQPRCSIA